MALPIIVGVPGKVSRTKLLELSARIGVGPSLSFLRKQRGIRALLSKGSTADKLYAKLAPAVDDSELNLAGFHIFTFGQLLETWQWQRGQDDARSGTGPARPTAPPAPRPVAEIEQGPA